MKYYIPVTNVLFFMFPAAFNAASAENALGMIGWLVLGGVAAGMRHWALTGLSRRRFPKT